MSKIVIDIETKNTFADVGGKEHLKKLDVSVTCVYSYDTDTYVCFDEHHMEGLAEYLQKARLIIGFSINRFDIPVLEKYMPFNLTAIPRLDLLEEVELATGGRISLNLLAKHNLGVQKTHHGLEAITLYKEGNLKELAEYCTNDVKITKEVYEYGLKHGKIFFVSNRDYQTHEVPVNWGNAMKEQKEKKAENAFPTSLF